MSVFPLLYQPQPDKGPPARSRWKKATDVQTRVKFCEHAILLRCPFISKLHLIFHNLPCTDEEMNFGLCQYFLFLKVDRSFEEVDNVNPETIFSYVGYLRMELDVSYQETVDVSQQFYSVLLEKHMPF